MRLGYCPRESAHRTKDECGSAVVSIALVLPAVFVPVAFIPGISGQFYLQFAITIAVATVISAANSLTLSPALAAVLFKPHGGPHSRFPLARAGRFLADTFNNGFDRMSEAYGKVVRFLVSRRITVGVMLLLFAGLLGATVYMLQVTPRGFIPPMDQGYAIVVIQLPQCPSLSRSEEHTSELQSLMSRSSAVF